jgi:hypothetical protein
MGQAGERLIITCEGNASYYEVGNMHPALASYYHVQPGGAADGERNGPPRSTDKHAPPN